MTLSLSTTDAAVTLTATAEYPDPANAGQFLTDVAATIYWEEDSGGKAVTLVENATVEGVGTATVTPVASLATAMTVNVRAYAADPDGHTTPLSAAFVITVTPASPTDATQVTITGPSTATPAPAASTAATASAADPAATGTVEPAPTV